MDLRDILAPFPEKQFLDDYFFKRSLFVSGYPGKFDPLIKKDDLLGKACNSESVRLIFSSTVITLEPGNPAFLEKDFFRKSLDSSAFICITCLELHNPDLQEKLDFLKAQMRYPNTISLRGYITAPTTGAMPHYDPRAVNTLQISGAKEWWYSQEPLVVMPKSDSPKRFPFPPKEALEHVILKPGDLLSLPPGAAHCTMALEESYSVNLAFEYLR